jgi:membrane protein
MSVPKTIGCYAKSAWAITGQALKKFVRDNGLFLASGVAFSLLLYSLPLTLIMISVLGYTMLESQEAMQEVQSVLRQFLPRSEQAFAENVATVVADRGLLGVLGMGSFLLFSSMVFGSIRHVLNVVFQAGPSRGLLRGTAHDLLMMAFCTALLAATIGLSSLFTLVTYLDDQFSWMTPMLRGGGRLVEKLVSLFMGGLLIFGLYRFSPVRTLKVRSLLVGSVVTIALFELAKQGFVWYVEFARPSVSLYGLLGGFVFLFLWLYYASAIFVMGAEAAWAFDQAAVVQGKIHPVPSYLGAEGCERNDG